MTSPINNTPISTTVTTTPSTTTTTTVTLGDHTVSTTAPTGNVQTTAATAEATASASIAQAPLESVQFSPEISITTQAPTTGPAGQTASATNILGSTILRTRSDSTSSEDSDISQAASSTTSTKAESVDSPTEPSTPHVSDEADLGSLQGLRGTEAAEGSARAAGPGGTPDMSLPKYDPTDKASIISFLSSPSVQAKMMTKAGHLIFVDYDRGSFIFVRNGDWSTSESIAVSNGKTKDPVTNPKDLEMCIAKFCMAHETMAADWENNIHPRVAGQAGSSGKYDHLILSMKFHTAVIYGPWNSKESSSGYTPSVWRRGTEIQTGNIWGDVGPLQSINWSRVSPPPQDSSEVAFGRETPTSAPSPTGSGIGSGFQPVINVNLGGISTNVSVGGATTTTTTTTPAQDTPASTTSISNDNVVEGDATTGPTEDTPISTTPDLDDDDASSVSSTSTQWEDTLHFEEEPEMDNMAPPPSLEHSSTNTTEVRAPSLQEILQNVRQHLDTVYDEDGVHREGNQTLGDVVRNTENGVPSPTVLLNKTEANQDTSSEEGIGEEAASTSEASNTNELQTALQAVRAHLDVVYPETNDGEPIPVNQNLGDIISAVEAHQTPEPTKPEGIFHAQRVEINDDVDTDSTDTTNTADGANATEGSENTQESTESADASQTTEASSNEPSGSSELTSTLQAVRKHLDVVYPEDGNGEPVSVNQNLGQVIRGANTGNLQPTVANRNADSSSTVTNDLGQNVQQAQQGTGSRVTTSGPSALMASSGTQLEAGPGLEHLLPQLRAHLDEVFDANGNYVETPGTSSIGSLIQGFQNRTGSGGIVGPAQAATMVVATPIAQQVATTETLPQVLPQRASSLGSGSSGESIYDAAAGVTTALSRVVSSLRLAEGGERLNAALENTSSQGLSLMAAAKDVAKALSETIDTVIQ